MPTCSCGYAAPSAASFRTHRLVCRGRGYKCPKCPGQVFQTRAAYEAHIKNHTSRKRVPDRAAVPAKVQVSDPYKLILVNGQRVWQRQPEYGQGQGGLSSLAEPLDPKKWKGKKPVFDESQKQQIGRHPCLVHRKIGCTLCPRPATPKPNRSSTYRKRFVKK